MCEENKIAFPFEYTRKDKKEGVIWCRKGNWIKPHCGEMVLMTNEFEGYHLLDKGVTLMMNDCIKNEIVVLCCFKCQNGMVPAFSDVFKISKI